MFKVMGENPYFFNLFKLIKILKYPFFDMFNILKDNLKNFYFHSIQNNSLNLLSFYVFILLKI